MESTRPSKINTVEKNNDDDDPGGLYSNRLNYLFEHNSSSPIKIHISAKKIPFGLIKPDNNSKLFLKKYFPYHTVGNWQDWKWQIKNSIVSKEDLNQIINLSPEEENALEKNNNLPLRITPYYASLINPNDPLQPLRKSIVPVKNEFYISAEETGDPLSEDKQSPVAGIVHRYPDRVLFLTTGFCSSYCRYCTRSRLVGREENSLDFSRKQWDEGIEYIKSNSAIRDVLLSGGDPLTLEDDDIDYLLAKIKAVPHVEIIRIGTKLPAVLPQRITSALARVLKKYAPVLINVHFTHPDELSFETAQALAKLADAGIMLGSQTVLLKGINDNSQTLKKLFCGLLKFRVRPYYLYQCDPVHGSGHFRTPVNQALKIMRELQGNISGCAIPKYVIDAPGGGGKIPLLPQYLKEQNENGAYLENFEGHTFVYPDTAQEDF